MDLVRRERGRWDARTEIRTTIRVVAILAKARGRALTYVVMTGSRGFDREVRSRSKDR